MSLLPRHPVPWSCRVSLAFAGASSLSISPESATFLLPFAFLSFLAFFFFSHDRDRLANDGAIRDPRTCWKSSRYRVAMPKTTAYVGDRRPLPSSSSSYVTRAPTCCVRLSIELRSTIGVSGARVMNANRRCISSSSVLSILYP